MGHLPFTVINGVRHGRVVNLYLFIVYVMLSVQLGTARAG